MAISERANRAAAIRDALLEVAAREAGDRLLVIGEPRAIAQLRARYLRKDAPAA